MKNIKLFMIPLFFTIILFGCDQKSSKNEIKKIAIAQFIDHPGLNAAKDGFLNELKLKGYEENKNIKYDVYNAYGDNVMVNNIVNSIASKNYDLILTLATPISQAIKVKFKDKNVPIIYGVITDPISAGLVNSMNKPGDNNTASSDQWPYFEQIKLIKDYFPQFTKIGIPYNPGEINTKYAVEQTKKATDSLGLAVIEAPIYSINDVPNAINNLKNKVDIIYIPADNTAMTAAPTIIRLSKESKKPVLAGDPGTFYAGALIGLGVSYYDLGRQTAELAVKIFNGHKAGSLPVAVVKNPELMINEKIAKTLEIQLPKTLIDKADTLIQ